MIITVKVHTEAFDKLKARVEQFEAELTQRVGDAADRFGVSTTEAMKANHGRDAHDIQRYVNRTWDLTESIGFTLEPPSDRGDVILHTLKVFAAAPYAFDVEEGIPGRSRPYPFFWVEIYNGEKQAVVMADLQRALDGALAAVSE